MKLVVTAILISAAAACAVDPVQVAIKEVEISDIPDATKAYLIINASVTPPEERQPTWTAIGGPMYYGHLTTTKDIFELLPGRHQIYHLDFQESPMSGIRTVGLYSTPKISLKAGTIYYYGKVEIEKSKRRKWVRTIYDLNLYRRACEYAPRLFQKFEVVPIGPLASHELAFPPCDELSRDSGADRVHSHD